MFLFAGTQQPLIVDFVNKYFGEYVYRFQLAYTKPFWDNYVFGPLGKDTETVLGVYSPETAIPWYTVMFFISCLLTVTIRDERHRPACDEILSGRGDLRGAHHGVEPDGALPLVHAAD